MFDLPLSPVERGVRRPLELTQPVVDCSSCETVAARYRLALPLRFRDLSPRGVHPSILPAFLQVKRAFLDCARKNRRQTADLLLAPEVQAPLNGASLFRGVGDGGTFHVSLETLLPQAAFQFARAGLGGGWSVSWRGAPRPILSREDGVLLRFSDSVTGARFSRGLLEWNCNGRDFTLPLDAPLKPGMRAADGLAMERGIAPVRGETCLLLYDNNPMSELEHHPEKDGNALSLGSASEARWARMLGRSLDLVGKFLPLLREEMSRHLRAFVPVGVHHERHYSASIREVVGVAYLSLHPKLMTMVEAVIHEFQHNKLNMLLNMDKVLLNPPGRRHASPVRPDPRPLLGVLLAAHAFLPVAELYLRLLRAGQKEASEPWFLDRFRQIIRNNHDGMDTLRRHAKPTPAGTLLLEEMHALDEYFHALGQRISRP